MTDLDKQFHRTWDIIDDLDVIIEDCLDTHTKEQLTTLRNFYQARFLRLYQTVCRSTQFEPTDGFCRGYDVSEEGRSTISFIYK